MTSALEIALWSMGSIAAYKAFWWWWAQRPKAMEDDDGPNYGMR